MGSISVPINSNSKVQPGWIYLKGEQKFYPSKDKMKSEIKSSPCIIEVKEMPIDELINLHGTVVNNAWIYDIKHLPTGQTYKMVYCLLSKTKVMKSFNQENIDFEYASEVFYGFGIMVMLKFYRKYNISIEKIQDILNKRMRNCCVGNGDVADAFGNIFSVNVYYEGPKKKTYYPMAPEAFHEIINLFQYVRKKDSLEAIKANVKTLPPGVNNRSELMYSSDDGPRRSNRNQFSLKKFWDGVKNVLYNGDEEVDSDKRSSVKVIVGIIDANLRQDYMTTYQRDFGYKQVNYLDNKNGEIQSNGNVKANIIANNIVNDESESSCPTNLITPVTSTTNQNSIIPVTADKNSISPVTTDQNSIHSISKALLEKNDKKPTTAKHTSDNVAVASSIKSKVEQTKLRDNKFGTFNEASNDSKAIYRKAGKATDISIKEDEKCMGSLNLKDTKKHQLVKKLTLLKPHGRKLESELSHNYYYNSSKDTEEISKKTLLLFGTDDPGKLSLLNLLFRCSQTDENVKKDTIVDVASKVENISFYHFQSKSAVAEEWIIIVTPELNSDVLGSLKQFLGGGTLNTNALGFVVNSRSETLTSEERNFFSYIRSSFGEVSNHHLMTFLTFCEFSRNFPVLDEMKHQSIKSKCVFELRSSDLGVSDALEGDDLTIGSAIITRELKKAKKVFKTLKEMPLLSVKSMKIAQEKSFAETYREGCSKQFDEELEKFVILVNEGMDVKESVQPIWRLARLLLTLEGQESSERNLLNYMAKELSVISSKGLENKTASRCFLLLLFNCLERNFTATLKATIDFYDAIISSLNVNEEVPPSCSVLSRNNTVPQYCNYCKDIHHCARDTRDGNLLNVKCLFCECPAKSHSLWTFKDNKLLLNSFCEMANSALKDVCYELPHINLVIHFNLFMDCLSKTFPDYEPFWKTIAEIRK